MSGAKREVELVLKVKQQVLPKGAVDGGVLQRWQATGNDPAFDCAWQGPPLQAGWYLLDIEADVEKGRIYNPCFYPDYGAGINETTKVPVQLRLKAGERSVVRNTVLRFTSDVERLRFDPTAMQCNFALSPLRIRRTGRLSALSHMAWGVVTSAGGWIPVARFLTRMVLDTMTGGPSKMADRLYHRYASRLVVGNYFDYDAWIDLYDKLDQPRLQEAQRELDAMQETPKVSIILPTYNTPERWLRKCIDSVLRQVYQNWELCIADDASPDRRVRQVLADYAKADARIKFVVRERNGHIAAASNSALSLATGDYVALLDHDDELHPLALLESVKAFSKNPQWEMLFTDEDKIDESGQRADPYFKSDWNPQLMLSQNCVCHLTVYRRWLLDVVGGFSEGVDGAQDWDLTLKVSEQLGPDQIGHVPQVLYHWRTIKGSTALSPGQKNYAHRAAIRALQAHLDRSAPGGKVLELPGYSGYYRIRHAIPTPAPLVSLLIPTRDGLELIKSCVESIVRKTSYPNYEIVILNNQSLQAETLEFFSQVQEDRRIRVVDYDHPFNYSAINNFGARHARGDLIGLLNNDIEVISPDWLEEMVSHANQPRTGVVGAMLYYPNDTIQHAGVVLGIGGVAGHIHSGKSRGYPGDKHRAGLTQAMSAVTAACMVVRKEVFVEAGGLDEKIKVAFNDIDFCLRVRALGYVNVWTPFAEFYHHESATRGYEDTPEKRARFVGEERFMKERWGDVLLDDRHYNPNLSLSSPFSLAFPPRDRLDLTEFLTGERRWRPSGAVRGAACGTEVRQ